MVRGGLGFVSAAGWLVVWAGVGLDDTVVYFGCCDAGIYAFSYSFFPCRARFCRRVCHGGVAYAAERVEQQARIDWRASLVVLVRCAGALVLLGLLNVVFEQLLLRVGARLEDYAMQMAFQSPQSPLLRLVFLINS